MNLEKLRYPIGRFEAPETISSRLLEEAITILEIFPENLKAVVHTLDDKHLEKSYREGGWSIRQLVHHIADSHHNSYTRFKWALTEDNPLIKAYDEKKWADLQDSTKAPIAWSLTHIETIHHKLVYLLRTLNNDEWERQLTHPETNAVMDLKTLALMYSWHSMHHFTHIKNALQQ